MTKILSGKEVAAEVKKRSMKKIEALNLDSQYISVIRLGENPGDLSYEKSIRRYTDSLGLKLRSIVLEESIDTEGLARLIEEENKNQDSLGILLLRPLPGHIDQALIEMAIDPAKDIDCMNPLNLLEVFKGRSTANLPCTPKAVMEILDHYKIGLESKNILIINRTLVVGKPLAMMLLDRNASVSIAHSKTRNLKELSRAADIVVTAMGRSKSLNRDYFREDSIVIDVGTSLDENGRLSGDLDYEDLKDYVGAITPVPGGVGAVTTSLLIEQALK